MIFLPGSCERCPHVALLSSDDCIGGRALCGACGGLVSILPGRAYPEGDLPLFDELRRIIDESGLSGLEALHLAATLQETYLTSGEQEAMIAAAFWMPRFEPLRRFLANTPERCSQALSMLDVIMRARAQERRSGFMRQQGVAASAPEEAAGGSSQAGSQASSRRR